MEAPRAGRRLDLLAAATCVAAVALVMWPVVAGEGHLWGDFATWYFPAHDYAAERMRAGAWPRWNPYTDLGMPFAGEADHASFYPPSWLLHALSPDRSALFRNLEMFSLLHMAWAAISTYGLLRSRGCGRAGSLFGGLAFGTGFVFVVRGAQVSLVCAQSWLPLLYGATLRAAEVGGGAPMAAAGLAMGMIALSGSPSTLAIAAVGLPIVALLGALAGREESRDLGPGAFSRLLRAALLVLLVSALGLAVGAVQLLPTIELVRHSERGAAGYDQVADFSFGPASLVMLVVPRFFGWLVYDEVTYWGENNFVELSAYFGILALVLAALALRAASPRQVLPWSALAAIGLGLALGRHSALHRLFYDYVPLLGRTRAPARFLVLFALGASVLGGLGLDALLRARALPMPGRAARRGIDLALACLAAFVAAGTLFLPELIAQLEAWKRPCFQQGLAAALISSLGAAAALLALRWRRFPTAGAAAVAVGALVLDLTVQGQDLGIQRRRLELGEPSVFSGPESLLKSAPGSFRVGNRMTGPTAAFMARIEADSGPGRHLQHTLEYRQAIPSTRSPMQDLTNVRYLVQIESTKVRTKAPNLVASDEIALPHGGSAWLPVSPPMPIRGFDLVSAVNPFDTPPGATIGEIDVERLGAARLTIPIRLGVETGDLSGRLRPTLGRPITVAHPIYVTDTGSLQRSYYLTSVALPPGPVSALRVRQLGPRSVLLVKEVYLDRDPDAAGEPAWRHVISRPWSREREVSVYENRRALPRAFLVSRALVVATREAALAAIAGGTLDPRLEVVLETDGALGLDPASKAATLRHLGTSAGLSPMPAVRIVLYEDERIVAEAQVPPGGAWLVFSEVVYPGWRALVDGQPRATLRAFGLFRAVRLEAGAHQVEFRYMPASFGVGLFLSLAGSAALLGFGLVGLRRRATAPSGPAERA